jgi:hypothetical protein
MWPVNSKLNGIVTSPMRGYRFDEVSRKEDMKIVLKDE